MIPAGSAITDMTLPWLFQDIRTEKGTGTAIFSRDTEVKKVYFKDGDILYASSNQDEDRLGEFLLRKEKITQEQLDHVAGVVARTGKKFGAVLFETGILTSHDLVAQVKLQIKEIILTLFGWRDGQYQFEHGSLAVTEIIPLHISTGDLIIEGVSNLDWKVVRKSLPPMTEILRPASDPSLLFQNAHLEQNEREVFSLIDGSKSMEDLCGLSGIGDFNTLKAIYVLLALRIVEKGEIKTEVDKKFVNEVVRDKKSAPAPALSPAETKAMIQLAYDGLPGKNHYEKLGVARNASVQEIKKAYFQHAKLYHPDRHFDPEMNDMKEKLEVLFSSIHEAYETLSEQSERDQYDGMLANVERKAAAAAAREEKPSTTDNAEVWYREGKKRYKAQNFWGAEEAFRWAMRIEPGNADYNFHLGLALSRIPRRGHEAEEYFLKATQLDAANTEYLLELGNFYMKNGLKLKALSVYHKALKYDPHSDKIKSFIKSASA